MTYGTYIVKDASMQKLLFGKTDKKRERLLRIAQGLSLGLSLGLSVYRLFVFLKRR
jgi:hypothetical protein